MQIHYDKKKGRNLIETFVPKTDLLSNALEQKVGYSDPCIILVKDDGSFELSNNVYPVVKPLFAFIKECAKFIYERELTPQCRIGTAYMRVIDVSNTRSKGSLCHQDNLKHGIRFTTAVSTDNSVQVNPIWFDESVADAVVGKWPHEIPSEDYQRWAIRVPNNHIQVFTREPHTVPASEPRMGHKVIVYFATFYPNPEQVVYECFNDSLHGYPHKVVSRLQDYVKGFCS